MKNIKSERGSITLYVLVTLLILSIMLLSIYIYNANMQKNNLDISKQIKETYEKDVNNVDEIYNQIKLEGK